MLLVRTGSDIRSEWIQRALWMGSCFEKFTGKFVVGRKSRDLESHYGEQACFQTGRFWFCCERVEMLLVSAMIELLDQTFL